MTSRAKKPILRRGPGNAASCRAGLQLFRPEKKFPVTLQTDREEMLFSFVPLRALAGYERADGAFMSGATGFTLYSVSLR